MRYKQNIYTITDEDKNGPNQEKNAWESISVS